MRLWAIAIALTALSSVAHAKDDYDPDVIEAKRHYERGLAHYNLREYLNAIDEFQSAYRYKPDPVFLYNLGQAHRLANDPEHALYFYRAYLRNLPDAENRAEVEQRIVDLERLQRDRATIAKPPDQTIALKPAVAKPAEPPPAAPVVLETTPRAPAPAPSKPVYERWWFWTVGGVVVAGAAVGLGVGLTQRGSNHPPSYPGVAF
ncbi:MAG TPA: hypothetical protein VFF06_27205 [Polyangia bacterium]|nr:hypothetical protein [Polyangia bacterium]